MLKMEGQMKSLKIRIQVMILENPTKERKP